LSIIDKCVKIITFTMLSKTKISFRNSIKNSIELEKFINVQWPNRTMYARAISLFHLFYIDWHWKENCSLFPQAYQFIIDTTANCTFRHRNLNAHFALLRCTVSGTVHQFQLRFINADLQRLVRSCAKRPH